MDDDDSDFAEDLRDQREHVASLRSTTDKLGLSESDSLVDRLIVAIDRTLRRLDELPRSDAFWIGRNRLATTSKLHDFCRALLSETNVDLDLAWAELAFAATNASAHLPDCFVWKTDASREVPIAWLAEASWIEYCNWGTEVPMMPIARTVGRDEELAAMLRSLADRDDPSIRAWAQYELRQR
jgi:hypothetical protein